jgi:long-chain acyl-CoA synthetase
MSKVEIQGSRKWEQFYSGGLKLNMDIPEKPIYYFLDKAALENPDNIALSFYDNEINYRDYKILTDKFARALQEDGVQKGDKIMILAVNCPQNIIALYGSLKAGAVPVLLNPLYTAKELEYFFKDAEPRMVLCLDSFYEKVAEAAKATPQIEKIITMNVSDYFSPIKRFLARLLKKVEVVDCPNSVKFDDFLNGSSDYNEREVDVISDPAVIVYTSGTTGDPKGVVLTHYNFISSVVSIQEWLRAITPNCFMLVIPIFHIYGCAVVLNWPILAQTKLVIMPKFHTKETIDAIRKNKVQGFFGVPAIYLALINYFKENPKEEKLSSLKFCSSGSAPIASYAWQQLGEIFPQANLTEAYGLSETTGPFLMDPFFKGYEKKFGSVGMPFPHTDVKIVNPETMEEVPVNTNGCLVVKSNLIFKEYLNKKENTEKAFKDGWFLTKDIGRMDERGIFYLEGRLDDMINVRGEKVWPREVEKVLEDHPRVREVAVVGVKDDYYGERVKAWIVLETGSSITERELIDFCKEKLTNYKVPREIEFLNELPKSNLGKTLHYKLREK